MNLINNYFNSQRELYNYFGFNKDELDSYDDIPPLKDCREFFWKIKDSSLFYCYTKLKLENEDFFFDDEIEDEVIFCGKEYTLIAFNYVNGNVCLGIFSNDKEVK